MRTGCCIVSIAALAYLIANVESAPTRPSTESAEEDGLINFQDAYGPELHISSTVLELMESSLENGYRVQYLTELKNYQGQSIGDKVPAEHKLRVNDNIDTKVLKSYG